MSTQQRATARPPVADKRHHVVHSPHGDRVDEYHWLRDDSRRDPAVLAYLAAENAYTQTMLAPVKELENRLFDEIVARVAEDDSSVPVRDGDYYYHVRFETGQEYPIHARKRGDLAAPEEVMLDSNQLAEGREFYNIAAIQMSPDGQLVAYAEDTVGRRQYTIRIKDLASGKTFAEAIGNTSATMAWASDSRTLLYVMRDPVTLLPYRVMKHMIGQDPASDELVYEETDKTFGTAVHASKSRRFLFIAMHSTLSSEVRFAEADDPALRFRVFLPREPTHEYSIEHHGDRFVVLSNFAAENFRIATAAIVEHSDKHTWRDVIAHRDDALIHDFEIFDDFLAVSERSNGLRRIRIHPWYGGEDTFIAASEPCYTTHIEHTPVMASPVVRYRYSSLTTPTTIYDHDTRTGEKVLRKREPVLGDFDPLRYVAEQVHVPARDGAIIPVSLAYHKDTPRNGTAPLYLNAYGSYGTTRDPAFASVLLCLLDRGFVFAIAHVRGGQVFGRKWYEQGRLLAKKNTFHDFIDVTEGLIERGYAARDKVIAMGGSAGGLLCGAVANMRPDLYRAIVAHVPFVDAVTTMLDESLPLTTAEYDEWGDPRQKEYYDYMLSYSPYDNVEARDYPAMLVTTGLWDSQVQYFEPAKWVAKLRDLKTGPHPVLLHVNLEAGHGGRPGRFARLHEIAREYGFVVALASATLPMKAMHGDR